MDAGADLLFGVGNPSIALLGFTQWASHLPAIERATFAGMAEACPWACLARGQDNRDSNLQLLCGPTCSQLTGDLKRGQLPGENSSCIWWEKMGVRACLPDCCTDLCLSTSPIADKGISLRVTWSSWQSNLTHKV